MRVAFLGNFAWATFTTENDIRRSLESLGHEVIQLQETDRLDGLEYLAQVKAADPDWFQWQHTPTFNYPHVQEMLDGIKALGIPTVAYHLDLYRGLKREGQHNHMFPWWHCDHVFSPDGGAPEGWWEERGINHHWSPPGVLADSCYSARPNLALHPHPIIFVGSRGYHAEHPFRGELLSWLETTYGDDFKLYEHSSVMREHKLNVLYASAKVIIGDSCTVNGVAPHGYWSDRVPETLGRGGFLLHPATPGMESYFQDGVHLETFNRECFEEELPDLIDWALDDEWARGAMSKNGQAEVIKRHTYRTRMQTVIETVFPGGVK